ncbi:hypothetical protein MMC32_007617 [Xylographa parallela]|nr:hypothetical protein [Xylographa parallela]
MDDYFGDSFPWSPQVRSPLFPIESSQVSVQVATIFGSNGLEGSLFVLEAFGTSGFQNLTTKDYADFLTVKFGSFASEVDQQHPLSSYNNSVIQAILCVMCDFTFRCSAYRCAILAAAKDLPGWTYSFNQTPSCSWDEGQSAEDLTMLAATHTAEISKEYLGFHGERVDKYGRNAMPGDGWPGFSPNSSLGVEFQDGVVPGVVGYSMCAFWDKIDTAILQNVTVVTNGTSGDNGSSTGVPGPASSSTGGSASSTGSSPAASTSGAGTRVASTVLSFIVTLVMTSVFHGFSLRLKVVGVHVHVKGRKGFFRLVIHRDSHHE